MSISWKADELRARLESPMGFTLLETLVALVVAALFLAVFARALSGTWTATRTPMDVVSAVVLARAAAAGAPAEAFREASRRGFTVDRVSRPLDVVAQRSNLAPAPADATALPPERHSTPASMQLALPQALMAAKPSLVLRGVSIVVKTPLGRRLRLDTIEADDAPR